MQRRPAQLERAAKLVADKAGKAQAAAKRPNLYEDYRKLLETEKSLDAVMVATGSRWHAPLSVAFMKAGKHVYCEKPLVRKIAEARELIELVPKCKVATQHGTQGGSSKAFRRAVEIIRAGMLGQVRQVYMWCDGYGRIPPSHDRPPGEDPVPAGTELGFLARPVAVRPFKRGTIIRAACGSRTGSTCATACWPARGRTRSTCRSGPEAGPPDPRRGRDPGAGQGDLRLPREFPLRVPGPRRPGAGHGLVDGRRASIRPRK